MTNKISTAPLQRLRRDVKTAWDAACNAEGIPTDSKFVVFTNTKESIYYNELAGYETAVL